jgi:hypothetical protein
MNEIAIEELTKLLIKEYTKENEQVLKISKKNLIKFCIKLVKLINE